MSKIVFSLAVAILPVMLLGCAKTEPPASTSFFPENEGLALRRLADVQAGRGARCDGMLSADHFTEEKLNSLGMSKLRAMVSENEGSFPVVVYINLPDDDGQAAKRRDGVAAFLSDAGLHSNQFKLASGPNPATLHDVAPVSAAISKMDGKNPDSNLAPDPKPMSASDLMGALTGKK